MDIRLDADFILMEVSEAGDIHGLTDEQIEVIEAFDEDVIMRVMNDNLDDEFWDALDDFSPRLKPGDSSFTDWCWLNPARGCASLT